MFKPEVIDPDVTSCTSTTPPVVPFSSQRQQPTLSIWSLRPRDASDGLMLYTPT